MAKKKIESSGTGRTPNHSCDKELSKATVEAENGHASARIMHRKATCRTCTCGNVYEHYCDEV